MYILYDIHFPSLPVRGKPRSCNHFSEMLRIAPSVDMCGGYSFLTVLLRFQPLHDSAISIFDRRIGRVSALGKMEGATWLQNLSLVVSLRIYTSPCCSCLIGNMGLIVIHNISSRSVSSVIFIWNHQDFWLFCLWILFHHMFHPIKT